MENDPMVAALLEGGKGGGTGMLFGMSSWGLVASLVFSGIGYFYYKRGRYQNNTIKTGCGIALIVYPYFVSDAFYIIVIGALLMAGPYIAERF